MKKIFYQFKRFWIHQWGIKFYLLDYHEKSYIFSWIYLAAICLHFFTDQESSSTEGSSSSANNNQTNSKKKKKMDLNYINPDHGTFFYLNFIPLTQCENSINFRSLRFLREINFGDSGSEKSAILTHLEALNFGYYHFLHFLGWNLSN